MSGFSRIVRFDAVRSVAFGSITGSFVQLGTPFGHTMRIVKFQNTTDADVIISFDGSTLNDVIPAGTFSLYDFTSDGPGQDLFVMQLNTPVFIKYSSAPTKGNFYVTCVYGQGE